MKKKSKKTQIKDLEIDFETAVSLIKNYKKHFFNRQRKDNKTMYAWFDLKLLLNYLNKMKKDHDADGVRIYYGAVTSKYATGNKIGYLNRLTPVLVTTKKSGDEKSDDDIIDRTRKAPSHIYLSHFCDSTGYDFASLCPPDVRHTGLIKKSLASDVYNTVPKKKTKKKKR